MSQLTIAERVQAASVLVGLCGARINTPSDAEAVLEEIALLEAAAIRQAKRESEAK